MLARLRDLANLAQEINAHSRAIVSQHGRTPQWSKDAWCAAQQARKWLQRLSKAAQRLDDKLERWRELDDDGSLGEMLEAVEAANVDHFNSVEPGGWPALTGHECAYLAGKAVADTLPLIEPQEVPTVDLVEFCEQIAETISRLDAPALFAQIEAECRRTLDFAISAIRDTNDCEPDQAKPRFLGLTLDHETLYVRRGDREAKLTAQTMTLLNLLIDSGEGGTIRREAAKRLTGRVDVGDRECRIADRTADRLNKRIWRLDIAIKRDNGRWRLIATK